MQRFEKPEDIPHLLRHTYVADDFDKQRVQEMITEIANPANSAIYLRSMSFEEKDLDQFQYWYKYKYSTQKYSEEFMQSLKQPNVKDNGKKLDIPPENTLLPKTFDVLPEDSKLSQNPVLL